MKALTYDGVGKKKVVDKPVPKVENASDAVIKMLRTTICGTDLHILKGDVPTCEQGRTLGHEGIGIIEDLGSEVKKFKKGEKVLISCITGCAVCIFCQKGMRGNCNGGGGWLLGHTVDGTQAEYLRLPFADANMYQIPEGLDDRGLLFASDMLPTGLEVATLRGKVTPGCTVAIVGAGPVGLASALCAQLYAPRKIVFFDKDDFRLEMAKKIGATHTYNVSGNENIRELAKEHFGEIDGFDVAIEAVGVPATFQMCTELVGQGGTIANVGVHGAKVQLDIERLWIRSINISMALVSAHTIPMLLDLLAAKKLDASTLVTHDFKFSEIEKAYDVFGKAADNKALKVNIEFD